MRLGYKVLIGVMIAIGIGCGLCLTSLWLKGQESLESERPFPHGLPKQEIVFSPYNPQLANPQAPTLGFIYADGTGREEYTLAIYQGARPMGIGGSPKISQGLWPRWSHNGELLFSVPGLPPDVRVIDQEGRMYGAQCSTLNHGRLTFDLQGNILAPIYEGSEEYQNYQGYTMPGSVLIARHDLKNCRINSVFLLPIPADPGFVDAIGENPDGWLVAQFYDREANTFKILLYHPAKNVQEVFPGRHPSFSDDGEWLAYYRPDGFLTIRRVETDEEHPLLRIRGWPERGWEDEVRQLSMPGWSPDGKWLVYSFPYRGIYKVNRESGEEFYLAPGFSPDWR